ncbi:GDP-L-fucose synthase [Roseovarius nanhaiticus]|uniref:GDP-L-fucose synthase n=1 Tax=Roseovarius nanhaiticus TaxID=573024 RepID=A0A1N7HLP9_9RHOB|nr:GDP-L-fucose synthase [Roseovarius nanhaiticus]SEL28387.1 GDP-L-fucose synthase [Roseovarius nanhaiticus]SIS25733.1 GDP-L-fucose synthase [Roseovarius nanhaiticus]
MSDAAQRGRMLLTGGRGMVGRNIREHARAAEWEILAPSSAELDLTDSAATADYIAEQNPDIVVHAAGRVGGIQANMANPVAFLDDNTAIGRSVIMGARAAGVPRLLNLASTCIYPREAPNPLSEEMVLTGPLEPTNEGYALAKIMALRLCQYIRAETPEMQYKTLIPCNLYGRHDSFDAASSHMVPAVIAKIHAAREAGSETVDIWGDGTARREFMYAGDLADAVLRAAADSKGLSDLMNVGVGADHSVNEYYAAAAEVIGWTGSFAHDLSKPVGMKRKLCDTARQADWGWAPQTDLRAGMTATYQFYLERLST